MINIRRIWRSRSTVLLCVHEDIHASFLPDQTQPIGTAQSSSKGCTRGRISNNPYWENLAVRWLVVKLLHCRRSRGRSLECDPNTRVFSLLWHSLVVRNLPTTLENGSHVFWCRTADKPWNFDHIALWCTCSLYRKRTTLLTRCQCAGGIFNSFLRNRVDGCFGRRWGDVQTGRERSVRLVEIVGPLALWVAFGWPICTVLEGVFFGDRRSYVLLESVG